MNKPRHTPGPWTFDGLGIVLGPKNKTNGIRDVIARVESGSEDACLITHAPDMFDDLRALTGELCTMAQDQGVYFPEPLKQLLQQALTTLTKIEGGAK